MTPQSITPLLNVKNCAASLAFYRDMLGFSVITEWESEGAVRFVHLKNGPVELSLNQPTEAPAPRGEPYSGCILFFRVESVHDLYKALKARGCNPREPTAESYGIDEMHLADPDGYWLGFSSPLSVARSSA